MAVSVLLAVSRAVLFDLDGTLTDPKPGITECIRHALAGLGRTAPPADELVWCIGPPLFRSFATLLDTDDRALVDRAVALYRERFGVVGLYENAVYPGVPDAVAAVRAAGYATYVATSKPHVYATRIVEHFGLGSLFDRVYGSELDGTRVDKGALIAYALAAERLDPARVVMIGDREHDALGARRCGVRAIGAGYGYGSDAELRASGVAAIAGSPAEIPALVTALMGVR
ncbi:MAG: HAD-IA family hydrolase [Candidatus Rokubacteria bacterium]|nr:HAD-IA family hydrolase [Candidatus Rokubacteria bacterium]